MKKILNLLNIGLILAGLISCSEEMPVNNLPQENTRSILIELPYSEVSAATRAIPIGNAIHTLDILAFNEEGKFLYRSESQPLYSIDNGNSYLYTIGIQEQERVPKQSFVFIANLRDKVKTLCAEAEGKQKEEMIASLTYDNCNWTESKTGLPMWSETSSAYDVTTSTGILDKIKLLRSAAAIEVLVNGSLTEVQGLDNFKLSDIVLKDFESEGLVAPAAGNYQWSDNAYTVSAPSIPEGSQPYEGYTISAGSPFNSIQGQLFVPEYNVSSEKELPSLLIGGYYGKGNTTNKSWYKVNLVKNGTPVNILRNQKYVLNITAVSAEGLSTPEEAYANQSQNIRATLDLKPETAEGLNNVVYDAAGFLAASASEVELSGETSIDLLTNVLGGWSFASVPDWLKVSIQSGAKDHRSTVTVSAKQPSSSLRSGILEAKAGTLILPIHIKETKSNEITYVTATAQQVIGANELGIPASEFTLSGGVAFHGDYLYIGNSYYKTENGKFTKRPALIVYDMKSQKVVKKIEEWTFNGNTLNFEGNTTYPDAIRDIVADAKDNRLYIMRQHHAVEVFDISNPASPLYVTRIGELMSGGNDNNAMHFRHSSAVGVCDRAVLIRGRKALNTYERNTITPENFQNIKRKTTDNKNLSDLGEFIPRQFASDGKYSDKLWLTEYGDNTFKGLYLIDVSSMDLSTDFDQYKDMRAKSIPLGYNPTGMAIQNGKAYVTRGNGNIDILDMNTLYGTASRNASASEAGVRPIARSEMKDYQFGQMSKLYPGAEDSTFWSCDSQKNNLVLIKVGKGTIIM